MMDRPSNQVLREFGDHARQQSKENRPPQSNTLASPIRFTTRRSYDRLTEEIDRTAESKTFPARMILTEPKSGRHVTFEGTPGHSGLAAMHPAFRPQQRPPPGRARAATPLDMRI